MMLVIAGSQVTYALLAFIYRLNILFVIASALIPKYLGVGAAVTVWGGIVMFLAPLMQDRPKGVPMLKPVKTRLYAMRIILCVGLILALFFVKLPFQTTVPVTLGVASKYQFTIDSRGYVVAPVTATWVTEGQLLLQLGNPELADRLALAQTELDGSRLSYETVRGDDAAKARAAEQAIEANQDQVSILQMENAGLSLLAPGGGVFVPHRALHSGTFLDSGSPIGAFFPNEGRAQLSGPFHELYYDKFRDGADMVTLRIAGDYHDLRLDDVELQSTVTLDSESGARSYTLKAIFDASPAELAHLPATIRVRFPPTPLWEHAQFLGQKIIANFREAQLLDRQKLT